MGKSMRPGSLEHALAARVLAWVAVVAGSPGSVEPLVPGNGDCFIRSASVDGRFLGCRTPANELAILDRTSGERTLTVETEGDVDVYGPVMAPDGGKLVGSFVSRDAHELRVIDSSGASEVIYREAGGGGEPLAWSRDGRFIAVILGSSLAIVAADGSSSRVLAHGAGAMPRDVSLAPDGRHVLYADYPEGEGVERDLFLLPANGGPARRLTALPGEELFPAWLADGSGIFFLRSHNGTSDAWLLLMDGDEPSGPPEKLQPDVGDIAPFALTATGDLLFTRVTEDRDVYLAAVDFVTGQVVTQPRPIAPGLSGAKMQPSFSPDGNRVLFESLRGWGPRTKLVIHDLATGERRVHSSMRHVHLPVWSRDGSAVLARGIDAEGRDGTFALDPDTGAVSRAAPDIHDAARSRRAKAGDARIADVKALIGLEAIRHLTVHPDGRHIAFTAGLPVFEHYVMTRLLESESTP